MTVNTDDPRSNAVNYAQGGTARPIYRITFNGENQYVRLVFADGTTVDYHEGERGYAYNKRLAEGKR